MEDTEWNDILRQHGILPQLPQQSRSPSPEPQPQEEPLDESDDEFYRKYRLLRLEELKNKSGSMTEIGSDEFKSQVTQASQNQSVVVFLYKHTDNCRILNETLNELAKEYGQIKFVKIESTRAIPNYPDKNVPTLLVYGAGDVMLQMVAMRRNECEREYVEYALSRRGIIHAEVEEPKTRVKRVDKEEEENDSD